MCDKNFIREYTDVSIPIDVEGYDLAKMSGLHVTFTQGQLEVDITDVEVTGQNQITVNLSQADTGKFKRGEPIKMMLNYFNEYGKRKASEEEVLSVKSNLLRRILNYE